MSVAVPAQSRHVCVCLNCSRPPTPTHQPPCQSSSIRWANKSRQGFSKAGGGWWRGGRRRRKKIHPITKAHHLAPAQLPSVNEAQSFLRDAHPPRRSGGGFAHTLCQQQKLVHGVGVGGRVLCAEGVRLFTFVAARIDEVAEAEAGAPC